MPDNKNKDNRQFSENNTRASAGKSNNLRKLQKKTNKKGRFTDFLLK